jgi:hypothetical protein
VHQVLRADPFPHLVEEAAHQGNIQ